MARLAAALLVLGGIACFALPWVTVNEDTRRAHATGFELVRREVTITGSYVHDSSEGDVEVVVHNAETWARIAFALLVVALGLLLAPWRPLEWGAGIVAGLGTLALLAWTQAATADVPPPDGDRHGGFWVALLLSTLALVPLVGLVRHRPRYGGGEWLDESA